MDGKTNAQVASTTAHFRINDSSSNTECIFKIGTISGLFTKSSSTYNVYSGYGYGNGNHSGAIEIIVPVSDGIVLKTSYNVVLYQGEETYWTGYTDRTTKTGLLHRWARSSAGTAITKSYKITGYDTSGEHTGTSYLKSMFEPNVLTESKCHIDMAAIGDFYYTSKDIPDGPENQVYICCDYNGSTYSNISFKDANGDACDMDGLIANGIYSDGTKILYFIPGITKIEYYDTP